ncbi:DUF5710 domain-containing protein [Paraburkholderia oxyphila]|uniref:DUF5710 domain-containing protein n=1 Tax=Paraburkholderia oxyphila TaxID=614212 RepID=UPI0004816AB9|nr:DUF5710 domain-containing protein [Paraburkholderia oxyphila]
MADRNRPESRRGGRTYLDVPFREKEAARGLGAKFDRRSKKWYVPGGTDVAPFARWMTAAALQAAQGAPGTPDAARDQPRAWFGSEADIEREAVRLSELMGQPLEESRTFVRDSVQAAAERAGLEARDRLRAQGASAFDMIDGVRKAGVQARHQYFADRQHLYAQGEPRSPEPGARAGQQPARPKLDDATLGRRYREMVQSITTAVTLHGAEVTRILALEQRLETIHRDAWRRSGNPVDGERAIGEQIRTGTGFAAQALPPRAAGALNRLRDEAGLSAMAVDGRQPAPDVTDSSPPEDEMPVDVAGIGPQHPHRRHEPERDDGFATFADIAEAFAPGEAVFAAGRGRADSTDWSMVAKDLADFRGLTGRIQEEFGKGRSAPEVAAALEQELAFLSAPARTTFVSHVREALDRQVDVPSVPQEAPTVKGGGDTVTFADVGDTVIDHAAIDDAMRRRGLTESAVPGNPHVEPSAVTAAVANEPVARPGQAANDTAMKAAAASGVLDTQAQRAQTLARNEPDARNPANDPRRPEADTVSAQDLERVRTVREGDRAAAGKLLREQGKPAPAPEGGTAGAPAAAPRAGQARSTDTRDNQIGADPASRKPVVTKDGYEVPAHVASRYMVKDGRFWKLDAMEAKPAGQPDTQPAATPVTQPHFEDVGARLNSRQNDRATIADMVAVAKAKNWDTIVVRGSATFRRNAWIEASLAGVDVKGFKPAESDEALLEAARRERAALTIRAGASPASAPAPKASPANAKPQATASTAPVAASAAAAPGEAPKTVAQLREVLEKSLERAPARMRAEVIRRFDARIQAGTEIEARIARGELSRDAGAAEIDRRAAELHAAWTAPKAAPAPGPSNSPKPDQQQTGDPATIAM